MFYLYILISEKTNKFYVGSTANLVDRIKRHNQGRSTYTKTGIPLKLIYTELFDSKSDAYHREMENKGWKSHARIQQLIDKNAKS